MEPINGKYLTIYADGSVPVHAQVVPVLGLRGPANDIGSLQSALAGYNERAYNLIEAWQHNAGNATRALEPMRHEVAKLQQMADGSHQLGASEELPPNEEQGLRFEISKACRYADEALHHLDEYLKNWSADNKGVGVNTADGRYSEVHSPYYGDDGQYFERGFGGFYVDAAEKVRAPGDDSPGKGKENRGRQSHPPPTVDNLIGPERPFPLFRLDNLATILAATTTQALIEYNSLAKELNSTDQQDTAVRWELARRAFAVIECVNDEPAQTGREELSEAAHRVCGPLTMEWDKGTDNPSVDDSSDVDELLNELGARLADTSEQPATPPGHWLGSDVVLVESNNSADMRVPPLEEFKPPVSLIVYWPTLKSVDDRGFARIPEANSYDDLPEALASAGLHELYGKISSHLEAERQSGYEIRARRNEASATDGRRRILEEESFFVTAGYSRGEGESESWLDRMSVSLVLRDDAVESVNSGVLRTLAHPKAAKCYFIQAGKFIALSSNRDFNEYDSITQAVLRIAAYQEIARDLPPPASGSRHVGEIERVPHRTRTDEFRITAAPAGSKVDIGWVTDLVTTHTNRPSYVKD